MDIFFRNDIQVLCKEIEDLLVVKNAKYGNSFDTTRDKYGPLAYVLRLEDKLNRIYTLAKSNDTGTTDESVEDTLKDIIGYTILELIYRKKDKIDPAQIKGISKEQAEKAIAELNACDLNVQYKLKDLSDKVFEESVKEASEMHYAILKHCEGND